MLCDVVRRRRRWAHAPVIHAASHFDHKKRVAWVPISMHTCGSFFYNYGAPLGGPSGRRSSAVNYFRPKGVAESVFIGEKRLNSVSVSENSFRIKATIELVNACTLNTKIGVLHCDKTRRAFGNTREM